MRGIGRMARESGLTVSALRFYDGAGVLAPAFVDPHSGYRWYTDDQVVAARLVARLRRVGLPLADICRVLDHRDDRVVVDEVLQAHLTRLEDGLDEARRELSAARALLDQETRMTTTVRTTAADLHRALSAVRHAASTDPELPMLAGVLLDATEGEPRVVATDRYRLALRALSGATVEGAAAAVLLPVALVDDALVFLQDADGPVTVQVDGTTVSVGSVTGQRLDLDFPDYRRVLRDSATHRVEVDPEALRAELLAAPTRIVPRDQDGVDQEVSVMTLGADGGLSFATDAEGVLAMGLNREFLLEALDAGGPGQLVLELDGPVAVLALRSPERADDVSLLMPIRLSA